MPYHFAIGFLAEVKLPQFAKDLMRTFKRPGIAMVDLILTAAPLTVLFAVLAFVTFRWFLRPSLLAAVWFAAGWAFVAIGVLTYGHHIGGEDFSGYVDHFVKWPHALLTQFAPVIGVFLGTWVALRLGRGEEGASAT